jgi:flagellar biosynthesis protein FliQ
VELVGWLAGAELYVTPDTVIDLMRNAIEMGAMIAGPSLLVCLVVGVGVSIVQATTQINDMTMVFIPKVLAVILTLVLCGSWMLQLYIDFTRQILRSVATLPG